MNILVTGGAGYIGCILTEYLMQMNHEVTLIDNFMYKQTGLNHLCENKKLTIVNGDIRNPHHMSPLLKKADVIIPLAALVGAPLCNKVAVEQRLMERENSISYRLATVFGMSPRMRTDLLVNDLVYRAVNDGYVIIFEGHFKRNYIHVRDVCEAFLHAMYQFDEMKSNIYNVGLSSANVSKLELCDIIKKHIPTFTVIEGDIKKDPDQRNYIVSNEKLEATGWLPYYTIDDGVEELIKGYTYLKNNIYGNV